MIYMDNEKLKFEGTKQGRNFHFTRQVLVSTHSSSNNITVTDQSSAREAVKKIIDASLKAVDPKNSIRRFLKREGNIITVGNQEYNLDDYYGVKVFGAGKAGAFMARAVTEIIPEVQDGLVIVKDGHVLPEGKSAGNVEIREAGHPKPNQAGLDSTKELLNKASEGDKNQNF